MILKRISGQKTPVFALLPTVAVYFYSLLLSYLTILYTLGQKYQLLFLVYNCLQNCYYENMKVDLEKVGIIAAYFSSNTKLELMKSIAETYKNTKATTLSNQTHREKPWLSTSVNSVIDYKLADGLNIAKILPGFVKT